MNFALIVAVFPEEHRLNTALLTATDSFPTHVILKIDK